MRAWRRYRWISLLIIGSLASGWAYRQTVLAQADTEPRRPPMVLQTDLLDADGFWLAPEGAGLKDDAGDRLLQRVLAAMPVQQYQVKQEENLVVFMRGGVTDGARWLTFACINRTGPEVYAFSEKFPLYVAYARLAETRTFWSFWESHPFEIKVGKIARDGDMVHVTLEFNGSPNRVHWYIKPATRPVVTMGTSLDISPTVSAIAYESGWVNTPPRAKSSFEDLEAMQRESVLPGVDWWPSTDGFELREGTPARRIVPATTGIHTVSFLPDGWLAGAAEKKIVLVSPGDEPAVTHVLPKIWPPPEHFTFSPAGTRLFIAGTSEKTWLLDVLSGRVRQFMTQAKGMPRVSFLDEQVMVYMDNVQMHKVDWESMTTKDIIPGKPFALQLSAAGLRVALGSPSQGITIHELERGTLLKAIQERGDHHQLGLSPNGRWLVIKGSSELKILEVETGQCVWQHEINHDLHTARSRIKWSADGQRGAAAGMRYVYVWSLDEPRWVARFPHEREGYWPDVALSADGRSMAASAVDSYALAYWPDLEAAIGRREDLNSR